MIRSRLFRFCALLIFISMFSATAQNFDVQAYQDFLNTHKNLTSSQLQAMYTAPLFKARVKSNPLTAYYLDSIRVKYNLTQDELDLLSQNGFVVSERLSEQSMGSAFLDIYQKDLPVFVTTDAILHALHKSYDEILKTIEKSDLNRKLETAFTNLQKSFKALDAQYGKNTSMQKMLDDVDIYFTVTSKLLGLNVQPNHFQNVAVVNDLLSFIKAEQPQSIKLFSETQRIFDFSQFTPRGHYTDDPELTQYFQAMIWLGRTELMLTKPNIPGMPGPTDEDIQRQAIDAYLIHEAVHSDSTYKLLGEIDRIIKFMVGESDNVTLDHLSMLQQEVGFTRADELLDMNKLKTFQSTLKEKSYAIQRILSQIILRDPMAPGTIEPPAAFLILGQRFVIDSYVMGSVVFDKIDFNGVKVFRPLPSSLDPMFALGNDASAQLLQSELDQYHYAPNLAALRFLIDSYESDFWNISLYNTWLQSIRTLNSPKNIEPFPSFMQTGAWWQQKINTQLSSWSQLRHDNLLYAKQSYTGGYGCSYPYSYVEPFTEFYKTIAAFARNASTQLSATVGDYFSRFANVMDTLGTIAQKELDQQQFTVLEKTFLKKMLSIVQKGCTTDFNGWYTELFYAQDVGLSNYIIADVHTQPTDEMGNPVGHVLHVGTGDINLGIITAPRDDGTFTAFVGPMLSYVEHVTSNFKRFTDKEWETMYNTPPSMRPSWVNAYLADKNGMKKMPGPKLLTDETNVVPPIEKHPLTIYLGQNYPNPFSVMSDKRTIISFYISSSNINTLTQLSIFDVTGRKIRQLMNQNVSNGNYFLQWDGKSENGKDVSSGVYFYRLTNGVESQTKMMMLIK